MSASVPPPAPRRADPPEEEAAAAAVAVLDALCAAALLVLGFVASVVLGIAAGWLSWLWASGGPGLPLAGVSVAVLAGVLFAGGRAVGWALGSRLGPWLLAAGWTAGVFLLVGYGSAGDMVMLAAGINYAYLFGGVTALAMAAMLSEPAPGRRR